MSTDQGKQDPGWKVVGPGGGGSTFYPTFHPTDPQRMALRCDMTGFYLSSDGGESWALHNLTHGVSAFAFESDSRDVVYVGAGGLFRTEDFGRTWQRLFPVAEDVEGHRYFGDHADFQYVLRPGSTFPSGGSAEAILLPPDNPETIYVGLSTRDVSAVYISSDRGTSWREGAHLDARISGLFCAPANPDVIYAVTSTTVFVLSLEGAITGQHSLPEEVAPAASVAAGWDAHNADLRLYAVSGAPFGEDTAGCAFVSHDGGRSWSRIDDRVIAGATIPADEVRPSFSYIATSTQDSRTAYIACDRFRDVNPRGDVGLWYGILKTPDGGESWDWVYKEGGGKGDHTTRDGYVATNVADSWSSEAFGGEYVWIICTGVFPADPDIAVFTDWYRAMKTVNGGGMWTALYSRTMPDGTYESRGLDVTTAYGVHFDPFDSDHYAISYTDIAYWHTFDNGRTWSRPVEGIPPEWDNTCYWVQFDPEVKDRLWSAWGSYHDLPKLKMTRSEGWRERAVGGVAVSSDGGQSWEVSSDGLPEQAPTTCLLLDPGSPAGSRTLYAAVYGTGVYRSSDGGKNWQLKNTGISEDGPNAWELVFGADGALYLVVAYDMIFDDGTGNRALADGALYRSGDGAESWQPVALPAGARFPNSIAPDPTDPGRLYLSLWNDVTVRDYGGTPRDGRSVEEAEGGLLLSEDGGGTWRQIFDPEAYVYAATVDRRKPGRIYLVTFHHTAHFSTDYGDTWETMAGYDFHWGHRAVPDPHEADKVFLTTFGSSVWYGLPIAAEADPSS